MTLKRLKLQSSNSEFDAVHYLLQNLSNDLFSGAFARGLKAGCKKKEAKKAGYSSLDGSMPNPEEREVV